MKRLGSIEIKVLGPGDGAILANVAPEVFDDPIDHGAAREFLGDPRHHIAVAIDDGLVIGFASAVHYVHPDDPRPELWINQVGVGPSHQSRGIGTALLDELLRVGRELGCSNAWVLTDRENTRAIRLYGSGGGVEAPGDTVMFEFPLERE